MSEIGSTVSAGLFWFMLFFSVANLFAYLKPHLFRKAILYLLVPLGWFLRTWVLPFVLPICALTNAQWEKTKTRRDGLYGSQLPGQQSAESSSSN